MEMSMRTGPMERDVNCKRNRGWEKGLFRNARRVEKPMIWRKVARIWGKEMSMEEPEEMVRGRTRSRGLHCLRRMVRYILSRSSMLEKAIKKAFAARLGRYCT